MRSLVFMVLVSLLATGCHRTVYTNLSGSQQEKANIERLEQMRDYDDTTWQHFFVYGWVPSELIIDASKYCQRRNNVVAIKTRQTFAEGLVAALAGNYINIYSPYDAHVVCTKSVQIKR